MIFVDSNVPMYLVGKEHPHKRELEVTLERLVTEKTALVTGVEVLQEILHRYRALRAETFIQPAFDALYDITDKIFDLTERDLLEAKTLVLSYANLSARDALHAAQMKRLGIKTILTFDKGFDLLPGISRIPQ